MELKNEFTDFILMTFFQLFSGFLKRDILLNLYLLTLFLQYFAVWYFEVCYIVAYEKKNAEIVILS